MPVDYSKYPKNWKSEIRPTVLARAKNCCEKCGLKNYTWILRGVWDGIEAFQDEDGNIFNAANSEKIGDDYVGEVGGTGKFVRVVLTIAHLDHDTTNNLLGNLKALCQKCHLNHDAILHRVNSRNTLNRKRGLISLFSD